MHTGREIAGFRLLRQLGAGGMGSVWLAEHGGVQVALKVIHAHLAEDDDTRRRFLREGEIGRRVRHENVVATLGVGETTIDGTPVLFLAMEHVEGPTLRQLLDERSRLPESLCRRVGCEIAKGLAAVHAAGAVHRDVKPDNVVITAHGHAVKLMDLGVAKDLASSRKLSIMGALVGTILYAAPEQLRHEPIDGRTDLFALGTTLYELAAGTHPFRAADIPAVYQRILDDTPRPLTEIAPQTSPGFAAIVHRLLAKKPAQRFGSAAELALVLGNDAATA